MGYQREGLHSVWHTVSDSLSVIMLYIILLPSFWWPHLVGYRQSPATGETFVYPPPVQNLPIDQISSPDHPHSRHSNQILPSLQGNLPLLTHKRDLPKHFSCSSRLFLPSLKGPPFGANTRNCSFRKRGA